MDYVPKIEISEIHLRENARKKISRWKFLFYFLFFLKYSISALQRMSRDLLTPRELGEPTSQSGKQIGKNPGS